jgi:hypothetical protein
MLGSKGGVSDFGLINVYIGTSERAIYQRFAGRDRKVGKEGDSEVIKLASSPPLPSFSGLHAGLSHQGQRPKPVEDTVTVAVRNCSAY